MKTIIKSVVLLACMAMSAIVVEAKTEQINVSALKGELTAALRAQLKPLTYTDTAIIYFDQAKKYTLLGTVQGNCSVELKGRGKGKTVIVLDKGENKTGFKAFTDDTFLEFVGTKQHTISVKIHDLSIKLKEHSDMWWDEPSAKFMVKLYHANLVDVNNVYSESHNAACTNFDLRVCSNVTFSKCEIVNYNNCEAGGNLWLRGEQHHVKVTGCKFVKYGNDECLAIIGRDTDAYDYHKTKVSNASRTDIEISNNEFRYECKGVKKESMFNEMFLSILGGTASNKDTSHTGDVRFTGNTFYVNDLNNRLLEVQFAPCDTHKDIVIAENKVYNASINSSEQYYRQDFDVNDESGCGEVIVLRGNVVTNNCEVVNSYGTTGYSHLLVRGGNVLLENNKIVSNAISSQLTEKEIGVQLLWFGVQGGAVTMNSNVVKGLKGLATVSAGNGVDACAITASNNYFAGDTRIYCNKVKSLDLDFTANTFDSNNMNFFLQEFAGEGTLVFNRNKVAVRKGGGQLMTHWSKTALGSMVFKKLEVTGNEFYGVKEKDLLVNMTNVKSRKVRSNLYR